MDKPKPKNRFNLFIARERRRPPVITPAMRLARRRRALCERIAERRELGSEIADMLEGD